MRLKLFKRGIFITELARLMTESLDYLDNAHEIHMRLKQTIETMRAKDLPVLQDFKDMEAEFDREFTNKEQLFKY